MKKITERTIKTIEAGTMLYDKIDNKWAKVTSVHKGQYFTIDSLLLETKDSLKRCYLI